MFSPDLSSNPLDPKLEQHPNLSNNDSLKKELWENILGPKGIEINQLTIGGSNHKVEGIRVVGVIDDGTFSHVIVGIKFTNKAEEDFATANIFPATVTLIFDMLTLKTLKNGLLHCPLHYSGVIAEARGSTDDFSRLNIAQRMRKLTPEML